jgi:hypothetical protein
MAEFSLRCKVPSTPDVQAMIESEMKESGLLNELSISPAHRRPDLATLMWTATPFWVWAAVPIDTFLDVKRARPVVWDYIDKIRAATPRALPKERRDEDEWPPKCNDD